MYHPNRRNVSALLGASALGLFAPCTHAAGFPERPITFLLGVPPGGASDAQARLLGAAVAKQLGQPVVIVNRPGAGATLAAASLAQSKPDGYTICMMPTSLTRLPHLQKVSYDPVRDFSYIINVTNTPMALVVRSDSPFKSL